MINHLRQHRQKMGLSQSQLAHVVKCTPMTIVACERRTFYPDAILLLQFSKFFKVPPEELFELEGEELQLNEVPQEKIENIAFLGIKLPWKKTVLVHSAL